MTQYHFGAELFSDQAEIDDPKFKSFMDKAMSRPPVLPSAPRAIGPIAQMLGPAGVVIEAANQSLANNHGSTLGESAKPDDRPSNRADTHSMNDITREEFNAKLETIEVKMDARVESMTTKIDGFLAAQGERDKRLDLLLAQISKDSSEAKSSISSMKTTIIVTAISTVLAIVIGVASFNTSLTSNMMSAFQFGASSAERALQGESNLSPSPAAPATAPAPKTAPSPTPDTHQ